MKFYELWELYAGTFIAGYFCIYNAGLFDLINKLIAFGFVGLIINLKLKK